MSSEPIQKAKNIGKAIKWISVGAVATVFILVILKNMQTTTVTVLIGDVKLPLAVWLAVTFMAGMVTGGLVFRRKRK